MPDRKQAHDIEDVATVWATMAERGLTADEHIDLNRWLDEDSRHLGAFVRAQAAWIHAERASALGRMPEGNETVAVEAVADDRSRFFSRRMVVGGGGALAASIAAAYVFGFNRYRILESGVGEIRHVTLNGGTTLTLDTDTRVDIAHASNDAKLALIRGKLFLNVTKRQEMPLIVQTGSLILKTSEGAFGVQNLENAPISALVTHGSLIASQSQGMFGQTRSFAVDQGHALTLAASGSLVPGDVRPMAAAQQEQLLAWRDGMLSFGGEALGDAVRAFDRYSPTRIVVADPQLARQKVIGLFKADDPEGFATAIAASFGGFVTNKGEVIQISAQKLPSA